MKSKKQVGFISSSLGVADIDLGLRFALNHFRSLVNLSLLPSLLSILVVYVGFYYPLSTQQRYLLLLIEICSVVWLLSSATLFSINYLQTPRTELREILQYSFVAMPKVVISALFLSFISVTLALMVLFFVLLIFLFWAPIFCAFELAVKPTINEKYRNDDYEDIDDDEDVVFVKKNPPLLFAKKSIFDLGFARSVQFVNSNYLVTFELILLAWFFVVFPTGVMFAFGGSLSSFSLLLVKAVIGSISFAFISCVSSVVLLSSLSKEQLTELSIGLEDAKERFSRFSKGISFHKKILAWIFVILFGGFLTFKNFNQMIVANSMPNAATVSIDSIEATNKQLIFKLNLTDKEDNFRWLDSRKLFLSIKPIDSEEKKDQLSQPPKSEESSISNYFLEFEGEDAKDNKYLAPVRVMPYSQAGEALNENSYVPYYGTLKLVLYFDNPITDGLEKYNFQLFHEMFSLGSKKPILEGKLLNE